MKDYAAINFMCAFVTVLLAGVQYHVDHIHPLCKGGTHTLANLQIITARENLSKNGRIDYYDAED